jgi:hypothetical protein
VIPQRSLFSYIKPGEEDLWFWVLTEDFDETSGISAVGRWSKDFGRSWSKPCSLDPGFFSKLVLVVLTEEQGAEGSKCRWVKGRNGSAPGHHVYCSCALCVMLRVKNKRFGYWDT